MSGFKGGKGDGRFPNPARGRFPQYGKENQHQQGFGNYQRRDNGKGGHWNNDRRQPGDDLSNKIDALIQMKEIRM